MIADLGFIYFDPGFSISRRHRCVIHPENGFVCCLGTHLYCIPYSTFTGAEDTTRIELIVTDSNGLKILINPPYPLHQRSYPILPPQLYLNSDLG